jgi:protein gp37
MAEVTGIAWTDSTFNPWIGCTKVGPGCDHCYAEALDKRHRWQGDTHWGAGKPRMRTSAGELAKPLAWNKARLKDGKTHRVFCASLADVFDNEVPTKWRNDLFTLDLGNARADVAAPHQADRQRTAHAALHDAAQRVAGRDHRQSGRGRQGRS